MYSDAANISSPNTKELRELSNKKFLKDLLRSLKDKQIKLSESFDYVPIYIKISPDEKLEDLIEDPFIVHNCPADQNG